MDEITERIMEIETPPVAGELNFAANKAAYENYFINVAGILAANNQFQGLFLLRLNRTLKTFRLKLTSTDNETKIREEMYEEAQRLLYSTRLRNINEANARIRKFVAHYEAIIAQKDAEIKALLEDNTMIKTMAAKQEEEIDKLKLDPYEIKDDLSDLKGLGLTPKKDDNGGPDYGKGGYSGRRLRY